MCENIKNKEINYNIFKQLVLSVVIIILILSIIALPAMAQFPDSLALDSIAYVKPGSHLLHYKPSTSIPAQQLFNDYKSNFGLGIADSMHSISIELDEYGYIRYQFQQYHNEIPVYGGDYMVVEEAGRCIYSQGLIMSGLNISPTPPLPEELALAQALSQLSAAEYSWEDSTQEAWLRSVVGDSSATYYPAGVLWITIPDSQENESYDPTNYNLTYLFEVSAEAPMFLDQVFVDGTTGAIISRIPLENFADETGSANTIYHGTKPVTTHFLTPINLFYLYETSRGDGIYTWDMHQQHKSLQAEHFVDSDNQWTSTANLDNAAWEAHWAMEKVYDYYLAIHSRNSYDDNGKSIVSQVHFDTLNGNGFWGNSAYSSGLIYQGDERFKLGDGEILGNLPYGPPVSLEVLGHEFTHGVINYESNLKYKNESGALNESFSDMLGVAIDFYYTNIGHTTGANWFLGDYELNFASLNGWYRDMANPNNNYSNGGSSMWAQPDTYHGTNWYSGTDDNGGVHINSGVGNYWFYLLSVGGTGVNDIGESYNVTPIGIMKASKIAYKTILKDYLWRKADYHDAYQMTIQATIDKYGVCSDEHLAVVNAWHAIGISDTIQYKDVSIFSDDESYDEKISFENTIITPGINKTATSMIEVRLLPGFHAQQGSEFKANIGCDPAIHY